ncbi:uncharacterized protein BO96DRAFT_386078 [Aspergillus niger CBS 101883]|uniref:uncharacterized protein n=1 Tax=Aspergillus lacticoffeatus (strain CBS 101883) TaxID=1450533 RepID=UPI000D802EAF|nr:uncharacterized protein BO96DRAFT_386078 [Aspergillus niger CBS 101883]PYH59954.1 hypothetical protein BO96DRAFT_386078 [Aspergillus niger CBS 101883]
MSYIARTFSRIRAHLSRPSAKPEENDYAMTVGASISGIVWTLYFKAYESTNDHLLPHDLVAWGIIVRPFDIASPEAVMNTEASHTNPASYFQPLPESFLQSHPVVISSEVQKDFERFEHELAPEYPGWGNKPGTKGISLSSRMETFANFLEFQLHWPRAGFPREVSLREFRMMFPRHALPPKRVDWSLRSVHLCYTQPRFPHVKAIMSHGTDAHPDLLLRGELMMIAAVMHTMLLNESYLDHVIMPVMLFSFVGPSHVRILIAIHDGSVLRISKSDVLQCSPSSRDVWDLLVRYYAGGNNPKMSTTKLPDEDLESVVA